MPRKARPVATAIIGPTSTSSVTAVVCHAEPGRALDRVIARLEDKLAGASAKERPAVERELEQLA